MEGGPDKTVSESEDETGRRGGTVGGEEEFMGIDRGGSIEGWIWQPLPKHHGHKTGCLRVDSPPLGMGTCMSPLSPYRLQITRTPFQNWCSNFGSSTPVFGHVW